MFSQSYFLTRLTENSLTIRLMNIMSKEENQQVVKKIKR